MTDEAPIEVDRDYLEKLFVHVYCDMGQRYEALGGQDQNFRIYNQLNIARLARQLLVDGTNLFWQVNRNYRLDIIGVKLGYHGPTDDLAPIPDIYTEAHPREAALLPGTYLEPMPILRWLELSSMNLGDNWIKHRQVIKYVANQYGGVHLEPEIDDELSRVMVRFQARLRVAPDDPVLSCLNSICSEVLWSLQPLKTAIEERLESDDDRP